MISCKSSDISTSLLYHATQTKELTYLIGIIARFILNKKNFSRKNLQPTGSTSEDQAILVGHGKQIRAFLGQLLGGVKDSHLLQGSKLKILWGGVKARSIMT